MIAAIQHNPAHIVWLTYLMVFSLLIIAHWTFTVERKERKNRDHHE